ncbi:hypothetical protein JCM19037_1448 [Geomicrobium sp. JCM 19037]|uniref:PaaI family thioesterase n=1 Tax=Geomicrobium sp. JCM 19037 TaxID=1460634 RepID=UPI00045F4D08|nr:PaaI family thioesterase [Geomicrobium sp. JCM 19037]GAK03153.1 hypothetical protein JCM19037_1448 [Geomicrobium sp. JCM 19037]
MEPFTIRDFKQVANHNRPPPACDTHMNVIVQRAEHGKSTGIWSPDERFVNGNGVVMGGFLSGATDILMAYALASTLEDNQSFASVDLHTTFHRPIFPGNVTVNAEVEKLGKKMAYVTGELWQNDKKAASTVSSIFIQTNQQ